MIARRHFTVGHSMAHSFAATRQPAFAIAREHFCQPLFREGVKNRKPSPIARKIPKCIPRCREDWRAARRAFQPALVRERKDANSRHEVVRSRVWHLVVCRKSDSCVRMSGLRDVSRNGVFAIKASESPGRRRKPVVLTALDWIGNTPKMKADEHVSRTEVRTNIRPDGTIAGTSFSRMTGSLENSSRSSRFSTQSRPEDAEVKELLFRFNETGKGSIQFTEPTDITKPYWVRATFTPGCRSCHRR